MLDLYDKIQDACRTNSRAISNKPKVAIILGTGLGDLTEEIDVEVTIDYEDIPHFPNRLQQATEDGWYAGISPVYRLWPWKAVFIFTKDIRLS